MAARKVIGPVLPPSYKPKPKEEMDFLTKYRIWEQKVKKEYLYQHEGEEDYVDSVRSLEDLLNGITPRERSRLKYEQIGRAHV